MSAPWLLSKRGSWNSWAINDFSGELVFDLMSSEESRAILPGLLFLDMFFFESLYLESNPKGDWEGEGAFVLPKFEICESFPKSSELWPD